MMNAELMIQQAKASFDRILGNEIYADIIKDDKHLALLMDMIAPLLDHASVLDLGTGNGYLAFPIAELSSNTRVFGLDIAENAIIRNRSAAEANGLTNLQFDCYDGLHFPYQPNSFDLIVTRHALHHFPLLDDTLDALHLLLKPGGRILVADPMGHSCDHEHYIDKLMSVKGDGHVCFYHQDELEHIFSRHGFAIEQQIVTTMRFPFPPKPTYTVLYSQAPDSVRESYHLQEKDGVIRVGQIEIGNTLFIKQ